MKWHRVLRPALQEPVETARLRISPLSALGCLRLQIENNADTELMAGFAGYGRRRSVPWILSHFRRPNRRSRFTFEIAEKGSGRRIGWHGVKLATHRTAHLSIVISDPAFRGGGYAREARAAIIRHFARHAEVEHFTGQVDSRNFASVGLYRQLGFEPAGVLRYAGFDARENRIVDLLIFDLFQPGIDRLLAEEGR